MGLSEADTPAKLIDPAIHARGWTEDLIRREETAGTVEIVEGRARRRARGRVDCNPRVKVNSETQAMTTPQIEAWAQDLPLDHRLEEGKCFASNQAKRGKP